MMKPISKRVNLVILNHLVNHSVQMTPQLMIKPLICTAVRDTITIRVVLKQQTSV